MVLAGVIYSMESEIAINGESVFMNNSAGFNGGEKGRGTDMASSIVCRTTRAVLVFRTALL